MIEKRLMLLRSLEMLAHRGIEKPEFSFAHAQMTIPFTTPNFSFIEERTTMDTLIATLHILLQDYFT